MTVISTETDDREWRVVGVYTSATVTAPTEAEARRAFHAYQPGLRGAIWRVEPVDTAAPMEA